MTDIDILARCINALGRINVPIDYTDQIAVPIKNVRMDLITLYEAISEIRKKKEQENESVTAKVEEPPTADDSGFTMETNQNESGEPE